MYDLAFLFHFAQKLPFVCMQTCFHLDFIVHKNKIFLCFLFNKRSPNNTARKSWVFCRCFCRKRDAQTSRKNAGQCLHTKTSLCGEKTEFLSKIKKAKCYTPSIIIFFFEGFKDICAWNAAFEQICACIALKSSVLWEGIKHQITHYLCMVAKFKMQG